jgi:hypothetical protein
LRHRAGDEPSAARRCAMAEGRARERCQRVRRVGGRVVGVLRVRHGAPAGDGVAGESARHDALDRRRRRAVRARLDQTDAAHRSHCAQFAETVIHIGMHAATALESIHQLHAVTKFRSPKVIARVVSCLRRIKSILSIIIASGMNHQKSAASSEVFCVLRVHMTGSIC